MKEKKGVRSKQWIIEQSVQVFNTYGLDLTLNALAKHLNVSLGRISHFFSTRDLLFVAISEVYQLKLNQIRLDFIAAYPDYTLEDLYLFFGNVMDNQYDYRCAILYAAGAGNSRKDIIQHNNESYRKHKALLKGLLENLIQRQSITSAILEEDNYLVFEFKFINLFTSWVISKEIYYPEQSYQEMKPLFLKGLMSLFDPYLPKKG